jgi:hypothetical protein
MQKVSMNHLSRQTLPFLFRDTGFRGPLNHSQFSGSTEQFMVHFEAMFEAYVFT